MNNEKTDFFEGYDLKNIHDWYMDLANEIGKLAGENSTAPKLLQYYLSPKDQVQNIEIINRCENDIKQQFYQNDDKTLETNYFGVDVNKKAGTYNITDIYLEKIRKYTNYKKTMKNFQNIFLSKKDKTKGIISHVKAKIQKEYKLTWYSGCGFDPDEKAVMLVTAANIKMGFKLSEDEQNRFDVYVGLNTFTIKSEILVGIDRLIFNKNSLKSEQTNDKQLKSIEISIKSWKNKLFDYYDFKGNLGFPLPNPHYKKIEDGAIHPNKKTVSNGELKHTKLIALEKAPEPLANPFYIYKEFEENDPMLLVKNQIVELYE